MKRHRTSWKARFASALAVLVVPVVLTAISASSASAATIDGAITDVTVTPTNPQVGGQVTTNIDWTVPNGTQAGSTFTLTLAKELTSLPTNFTLTDGPGGPVVATAVISSTNPAVVTFTMTAYAASHLNVHGTAFIKSGFDEGQAKPGQTTPFTYTTNDNHTFTTNVTPQVPVTDPGQTYKYGNFTRSDDGRTNKDDAITWYVQSEEGPVTSQTITDAMQPGQVMDCSSFTGQVGTWEANGDFTDLTPYTNFAKVSCDASGFTVTTGAVPAGGVVRILFETSLTAATGDGPGLVFKNSADTTTVTSSGTVVNHPAGQVAQGDAGGQGTGETPKPGVTIVKGDVNGHTGDNPKAPVSLPTGTVGLKFKVTNTGNEPLTDVHITDAIIAPVNGTVTGLSCDFSAYGGSKSTVDFTGDLPVGDSVNCTATLTGVVAGTTHHDEGKVTAVGALTGTSVTDKNPYYAKNPTVPVTTTGTPPNNVTGGTIDTGVPGNGTGPSSGRMALGAALIALVGLSAASWSVGLRRRRLEGR